MTPGGRLKRTRTKFLSTVDQVAMIIFSDYHRTRRGQNAFVALQVLHLQTGGSDFRKDKY